MNQKEMLIKNIEDLGNELELQHPEYYVGYSTAINDVVQLVKILNIDIVSNNEVRVAVCSECDNYNNSQGSKICRNCYQKSHFVEQTDC